MRCPSVRCVVMLAALAVLVSGGRRTDAAGIAGGAGSAPALQPNPCNPPASYPTLSAAPNVSGTVTVSWSAVATATGYELSRSTSVIYTGSALSYTDTGLTSGTQVCYSVKATNACGAGPVSPQLCVTVPVTYTYSTWIPVASHAAGVNNSQWRTDLGVLNDSAATANFEVRLYLTTGVVTQTAFVTSGSQSILVDVVSMLGASGSGALEVRSDRPVKVSSRTYNQQTSGTFGQDYPSSTTAQGLSAGQAASLPQLTENAAYRTNIGLVNTGTLTAAVTVTLVDGAGKALTSYEVSLAPGALKQETQPFKTRAGQTSMARGWARVAVTAGTGVIAYASVIDNSTGDPTTILAMR
jgi:hypothetical protein